MIAFTICSNNYLAHAKTLGDSFLDYHPNFKFIIGLVDKPDADVDYKDFDRFEIIKLEDLNIKGVEDLNSRYTITEFNTSVKPSYFHYIFKNYSAKKVIYIDPDILITSYFEEVIEILNEKNIVITPHLLRPIDDEFAPTDYHTLRGGVFNLGFIALSNYEKTQEFLDWWHQRVVKYGYANFSKTMFYDQLWINYVPCLFDNYYILKHPGYNMANWNLHERILSKNEKNQYYVNQKFPLRFFHFSSYKFKTPESISAYHTRYNFITRPDLKNLFTQYQHLLIKNDIEKISQVKVYYYPPNQEKINKKSRSILKRIINRMKNTLNVLLKGHV